MSKAQTHSKMYKRGRYFMYNFNNLKQSITKMSETVSKSFSNVVFLTNFPVFHFAWLSKIKTNIKYRNAQNVIYSWISLCQTRFTRKFVYVEICLKSRFKLRLFNLIYHSYLKFRWSIINRVATKLQSAYVLAKGGRAYVSLSSLTR